MSTTEPLNMDMKPGERAVLYYLQVRHLEGRGGATYEEMASEVGLSVRTLARAVPALEKAGWLMSSAVS